MSKHYYIENGIEYGVVGAVGFLVQLDWPYRPARRSQNTLRAEPARTNMGHEPQLTGWCGTTDNIAVYALGVGEVVQVFGNGRARVRTLHGAELTTALDKLGWPDLAEDV